MWVNSLPDIKEQKGEIRMKDKNIKKKQGEERIQREWGTDIEKREKERKRERETYIDNERKRDGAN